MQIIQRSLDGAPLPEIRACDHLAGTAARVFSMLVLSRLKQCANCCGFTCPNCEDDAVICHACPASICKECQQTARKRKHDCNEQPNCNVCDYLCNPCRDKQDAAKRKFLAEMVSRDWDHHIWLDELLDKSECAIQKAKESL